MTCNPNWAEIKEVIDAWDVAAVDCLTIVDRMFKLKWDKYMEDILKREVFGHVKGYMWFIELVLDSKDGPKTAEDHDDYVCAEIPDPHEQPKLYALVMQHHIHVCGKRRKRQACFRNKKCSKGFPKSYAKHTVKVDDQYPTYRRLSPKDGGQSVLVNEGQENQYRVTNADVVPYNPASLLRTENHLWVEICSTISAVKYIFKYLLQGPDHIAYKLAKVDDQSARPSSNDVSAAAAGNVDSGIGASDALSKSMKRKSDNDGSGDTDGKKAKKKKFVNEVGNFRYARWWAPPEAFWKIAGYTVHKQMPPVTRLSVHLEHEQNVVSGVDNLADAGKRAELEFAAKRSESSQLRMWMELNEFELKNPQGFCEGTSAPELLFTEIPTHYRWDSDDLCWVRRKTKPTRFKTIARMYTVHVLAKERYFLRRLLQYVRGAISFEDIRTVDDVVCETYREACLARNLLADDKEWHSCMEENKDTMLPNQLRRLLLLILVECRPSDPYELFRAFSAQLSADFLFKQNCSDDSDEKRRINKCYAIHEAIYALEIALASAGTVLDAEFLSDEYNAWKEQRKSVQAEENVSRLVREELDYKASEQADKAAAMYKRMNDGQMCVFDAVMAMVRASEDNEFSAPHMIFNDAPGGTGKTFVNEALCAKVGGEGKIVLAVASSGIAAQLLPGGRTAHFKFQIPLDIKATSTCFISNSPTDPRCALLKRTALIIVDEASMLHKYAYEAVDRSLRDLLDRADIPFAGIPMLFTGDFRQILPVVRHGSRYQTMDASLQRSKLWQYIRVLHLTENIACDEFVTRRR